MRLLPREPLTPSEHTYDVVISQVVGKPIDGQRVRMAPTGGSELATVLLAEGLTKAGYRVAVIQPGPHMVRYAGVTYYSRQDIEDRKLMDLKCEVLISERFGQLPQGVSFQRLVIDLHDLPDPRLDAIVGPMSQIPDCKTVVHSNFLAKLLPDWPGLTVIPAMLPDELWKVAASQPTRKDRRERTYVYGSAALKGLAPTLDLWAKLKREEYAFKRAKLIVTSPGYDAPDFERLNKTKDVLWQPQQTVGDVQNLFAASDGLFMVSNYQETYGCVQTQAEISGKPAWVLQLHAGDALQETLANPETLFPMTELPAFIKAVSSGVYPARPARNIRQSAIIPAWLQVLQLQPKDTPIAA